MQQRRENRTKQHQIRDIATTKQPLLPISKWELSECAQGLAKDPEEMLQRSYKNPIVPGKKTQPDPDILHIVPVVAKNKIEKQQQQQRQKLPQQKIVNNSNTSFPTHNQAIAKNSQLLTTRGTNNNNNINPSSNKYNQKQFNHPLSYPAKHSNVVTANKENGLKSKSICLVDFNHFIYDKNITLSSTVDSNNI